MDFALPWLARLAPGLVLPVVLLPACGSDDASRAMRATVFADPHSRGAEKGRNSGGGPSNEQVRRRFRTPAANPVNEPQAQDSHSTRARPREMTRCLTKSFNST